MRSGQRNIFVLALDPFNRAELETVRCEGCVFHGLLDPDTYMHKELPLSDLIAAADRELEEFQGSVDAIITHWDFPFTILAPILAKARGLRSPSLEAVLRCSNKYLARLEQQRAIPDFTPQFDLVDPFQDLSVGEVGVVPPFWLKPVAGYASQLGFRITDQADLDMALEAVRARISRVATPFEEALRLADLPPEIGSAGAHRCLVEEYMTGVELAHEGSVFNGEVNIHGSIDMVRDKEAFSRYEYPSTAPVPVLDRMEEATRRLLGSIGFDQGCFNAEFFWEPDSDRLRIVEVNPRISQSHAYLFDKVSGRSNHEVAIDVALGKRPSLSPEGGRYRRAAKFIYDIPEDGFVERLPDEDCLRRAHELVPDAWISMVAKEGAWLSENTDQDAYSFDLAEICVAADDQRELVDRYRQIVEALDFRIRPA